MERLVFTFVLLTGVVHGQSIVTPPADATETVGGTAKFSCKVDFGAHIQMVTWYFNDKIIYSFVDDKVDYPMGTNKYMVTHSQRIFTLEVRNLNYTDGGKYICVVINSRSAAVLIVLGFPLITPHSPNPKEGDLAHYTCEAQFGGPNVDDISVDHYPELKMLIDEEVIPEKEQSDSDNKFHFNKVYEILVNASMHNKELSCKIQTTNPSRRLTSSSIIKVLYSVRHISYSPHDQKYLFGTNLTCEASGNPSPSFEWRNGPVGILIKSEQLQITEEMVGDNDWTCTARNIIDGQMFEESITVKIHAAINIGTSVHSPESFNYIPLFVVVGIIVAVIAVLANTGLRRVIGITSEFKGKVTGYFVATATIAVFGNSFPHGWNTGVLNIPQHLIKDFLNSSVTNRLGYEPSGFSLKVLWAVCVSVYVLAGIVGVAVADDMADKFGRKKAMIFCHIFGFISAPLFGFCNILNSFEMLIMARTIVGFGCGASSRIVLVYLTEITPQELQSNVLVFQQFGIACGILLSQMIGMHQCLGQESLWPFLLALTAAPCLISCIALPWLPESPQYLVLNCKDKVAAAGVLKNFRGNEKTTSLEILGIGTEPAKWSAVRLRHRKELRQLVILVCSLNVCQQLSGINAVFYYSVTLLEDSGISPDMTQYVVLATGLIYVLMTGFSMITSFGHRPLLLGGMVVMIVSGSFLTVGLHLQNFYFSIISIIIYVIGFAIELGSIPQVIGRELFGHGPATPAIALGGVFNWLANFFVALSFPMLQLATGPNVFIIFIICLMLFGGYFMWQLKETKNKDLETVYEEFGIDGKYIKKWEIIEKRKDEPEKKPLIMENLPTKSKKVNSKDSPN